MQSVSVAIFAVFVLSLTSGQEEWSPEDMPNPLTDPKLCGLSTEDPAYICDPNRLLGDDIFHINWHLKDAAYNSTRCPCSNYHCEMGRGPLGYRIGVALVRRMKIQTSLDGRPNDPVDQAQLFANRLESTRWNMGDCEEDIIIFYSQQDKTLAIYGGQTALIRLTPYFRQVLAYKVGSQLNDGQLTEALNNLIYDLKLILNCDNPDMDCGVHQIRSGVSKVMLSTPLTFTAVLLSLYSLVRF